MWARSTPRWSSRPTPSAAISASVYGAARSSRRMSWPTVGAGAPREDRRAPDVAVVVADDVEAAPGEVRAEVLVPAEHLRPQAHDEQQGGVGGIAEGLEAELDVADAAEALGHANEASRSRGGRPGRPRRAARDGPRHDQLLRLALGRDAHDVPHQAELLHRADDAGRRVELAAAQAVHGRAREGVVVVVPRLAERGDGEPEDVGRVVLDVEAPAPEEVADGVDRPRHVVDEEDAHEAAPEQAGERAGDPAGDEVAGQGGQPRGPRRRSTGRPC